MAVTFKKSDNIQFLPGPGLRLSFPGDRCLDQVNLFLCVFFSAKDAGGAGTEVKKTSCLPFAPACGGLNWDDVYGDAMK